MQRQKKGKPMLLSKCAACDKKTSKNKELVNY